MKKSEARGQRSVAEKRKAESGKRKDAVARFSSALPSAYCPLPTPRRGISLTEVLISMGVLTMGLLGVAAMFPVGSYYMLKAEISDRSSAVAQEAFADLVGKGMLQPEAWVMDQSDFFRSPLVETYNGYKSRNPYLSAATQLDRTKLVTQSFGYAYVIDPLAIAHSINSPPAPSPLGQFPICNRPVFSVLSPANSSWRHFISGASGGILPIRRVTFAEPRGLALSPRVIQPMELRTVETLFQSIDDLAINLPDEKDKSGQLLWDSADVNGDGQKQFLARQSQGNYSWIASICPTTIQARDALLNLQASHLYDVSVVVFYKRLLGSYLEMSANEAVVRGHVATTGTSGGELILNPVCTGSTTTNLSPLTALRNLKVGEYIMVSGPHPESSADAPRLFLQWYQVISIEELDFDRDTPTEVSEARVALRGPDWPWLPAQGGLNDNSNIANDLRVGIFPGAVAVHTKTVRLPGGPNSGTAWSAGGRVPPGVPDSPYVAK